MICYNLSGLVAIATLSVTALATAAVPGIPAPPSAAPPFTLSLPPVPAPPSQPAPPPAPTDGTPTANPSPANPLPGTTDTGLANANGNVFPGMVGASIPQGDSYFQGMKSYDGYNYPEGTWYQDIYDQIYNSYYQFGEIEKWAHASYYNRKHEADVNGWGYEYYKDIYELYVYASYCRYYFQDYFWTYFSYDGHSVSPKVFDFDYEGHHHHTYASRGYFNYNYYYYMNDIYTAYLGKAASYYQHHHNDYNNEVWYGGKSYGKYSEHHHNMKFYYDGLEDCEYGHSHDDGKSYHDSNRTSLEHAAGFGD